MRKVTRYSLLALISALFFYSVAAVIDPSTTYVPDNDCATFLILQDRTIAYPGGVQICNRTCMLDCLYKPDQNGDYTIKTGFYCEGNTYNCSNAVLSDPYSDFQISFNFLGYSVDVGVLIWIRALLVGASAISALAAIALAVYSWSLRSSAAGNAEKVEKSMKIMKNVVIGLIIVFMATTIVQIVALSSGVATNLFDFIFIPKSGPTPYLTESDLGRLCHPNQKPMGGGKQYCCDPVEKVWKNGGC